LVHIGESPDYQVVLLNGSMLTLNMVSRGTKEQAEKAGYSVEHIFAKEGWVGTTLAPKTDTLPPIDPITLGDKTDPTDLGNVTVTEKPSKTTFGEPPRPSIPIKPIRPPAPNPPTVLEVLKANAIYGGA
jgi:hypothetical protein